MSPGLDPGRGHTPAPPGGLEPGAEDALLVIDVQKDFLPGGALPVPAGDAVIGPLNVWIRLFVDRGLPIFATRDWHPPDHCSFLDRGGPWPCHCVAHTPGAGFADALRLPSAPEVIDKPSDRDVETYSAFPGTRLDIALRQAGVRRLWVGGLATDYCVLNTVSDALQRGYAVILLLEAIRAVDAHPGDGDRAIRRMAQAGAILMGAPA